MSSIKAIKIFIFKSCLKFFGITPKLKGHGSPLTQSLSLKTCEIKKTIYKSFRSGWCHCCLTYYLNRI